MDQAACALIPIVVPVFFADSKFQIAYLKVTHFSLFTYIQQGWLYDFTFFVPDLCADCRLQSISSNNQALWLFSSVWIPPKSTSSTRSAISQNESDFTRLKR